VSDALLERLVADGAIARAAAEGVAARHEQAGGAIDTALLEMGLVPVARLPEILARVTGLPSPPEAAFTRPDPRARRVFPAKVAERHGIAPFALEGRELSVVTTYPPDVGLLDEVGFMLSLHLRAHVAPEWRVRALVRDLYGTPLPARLAALAPGTGRARGDERPAGAAPPPSRAAPATPAPAPPAPAPPASGPPSWTPGQAREALAGAAGRDEAIRAALRYARDFFAFAAVLSVRRDALAGHDALGIDPAARDACRRVVVRLAEPGLFGTALATRAPYLGPPPPDAVTASVLAEMGRGTPHTVLVVPVYVRDRPVCVLYADNDDAPVAAARLGDLFVLLGGLGAALERLIRARKTAPPEAEPRTGRAPGATGAEPVPEPVPDAEPLRETEPPSDAEPTLAAEPVIPAARESVAHGVAAALEAGASAEGETPVGPEPVGPEPTEVAAPPPGASAEDSWRVSEPARFEEDPLPFTVDVDLGEYEVASAGEALATGRAADLPAAVEALVASAPGSEERRRLLEVLVAGGPEAAAALVARLPGPFEGPGADDPAAPAERRGPVFAALLALGSLAGKPLAAAVDDPEPARRAAAIPLLARVGDPGAVSAIAARVFDDDPRVAAEAREALARSTGSPALGPVITELRRALASGRAAKAIPAARALSRLADADAVPILIQMLDARGELSAAAAEALERVTLQRLGEDPTRWVAWWREWRTAPRSSWLLQALLSPERDLRQRAADELRSAGEPPVTYVVDAAAPERDHAARAWAAWWREEGLAL
jgi:HEAT repeat protein